MYSAWPSLLLQYSWRSWYVLLGTYAMCCPVVWWERRCNTTVSSQSHLPDRQRSKMTAPTTKAVVYTANTVEIIRNSAANCDQVFTRGLVIAACSGRPMFTSVNTTITKLRMVYSSFPCTPVSIAWPCDPIQGIIRKEGGWPAEASHLFALNLKASRILLIESTVSLLQEWFS